MIWSLCCRECLHRWEEKSPKPKSWSCPKCKSYFFVPSELEEDEEEINDFHRALAAKMTGLEWAERMRKFLIKGYKPSIRMPLPAPEESEIEALLPHLLLKPKAKEELRAISPKERKFRRDRKLAARIAHDLERQEKQNAREEAEAESLQKHLSRIQTNLRHLESKRARIKEKIFSLEEALAKVNIKISYSQTRQSTILTRQQKKQEKALDKISVRTYAKIATRERKILAPIKGALDAWLKAKPAIAAKPHFAGGVRLCLLSFAGNKPSRRLSAPLHIFKKYLESEEVMKMLEVNCGCSFNYATNPITGKSEITFSFIQEKTSDD